MIDWRKKLKRWPKIILIKLRKIRAAVKEFSLRLKLPTLNKSVYQKLNKPWKVAFISIAVLLVVSAVMILFFKHGIQNNTQASAITHVPPPLASEITVLDQQLNEIVDKLSTVEENLTSNSAVSADQLKATIAELQVLSVKSDKLITDAIAAQTNQVQTQLTDIQKQLKVLVNTREHHKFVPTTVLPFKVLAIDNIQQVDTVFIEYDHTQLPMQPGDGVAGWTLLHANSANLTATFENKQHEYVQINLNQEYKIDGTAIVNLQSNEQKN